MDELISVNVSTESVTESYFPRDSLDDNVLTGTCEAIVPTLDIEEHRSRKRIPRCNWISSFNVEFAVDDDNKRKTSACFGCNQNLVLSNGKTSNLVAHIRGCCDAQTKIQQYVDLGTVTESDVKVLLRVKCSMLNPSSSNVTLQQKQLPFCVEKRLGNKVYCLLITKAQLSSLLCELCISLPLPFNAASSVSVQNFLQRFAFYNV